MTRLQSTIRSLGVVLVLVLMLASWQADTDSAWAGYERHDGEPGRLLQGMDDNPPILPAATTAIHPLDRAGSGTEHQPPVSDRSTRTRGPHPIRGSPDTHHS